MNSLLPDLIADISTLPWVAIIAVAGGLGIALAGLVGGLWFAHRRQAMWHETARLALEKGQPLPPMPEDIAPEPATPSPARARNDIRSGLVLIAVGIGLYLFLNALVGRGLGLVGAIPGFIGVALLAYGLVARKGPGERS